MFDHPFPFPVGQWTRFTNGPHLNELKIGCDLEMALQAGGRIGNDPNQGAVQSLLDAIDTLENQGVGADHTLKIQGTVLTLETSGNVAGLIEQQLAVGRGAIDGPVLKGGECRTDFRVPGGRGEGHTHQRRQDVRVFGGALRVVDIPL